MNFISNEFLEHDAYAYCRTCSFVSCLDCNVKSEASKIYNCPQCRNYTVEGYFQFILNCSYEAILSRLFHRYIKIVKHQDQFLCQLILEECPIDVIESMLDQGLKVREHGVNFAEIKGRDDVVHLLKEKASQSLTDFEGVQQLVRWNPDIEKMESV